MIATMSSNCWIISNEFEKSIASSAIVLFWRESHITRIRKFEFSRWLMKSTIMNSTTILMFIRNIAMHTWMIQNYMSLIVLRKMMSLMKFLIKISVLTFETNAISAQIVNKIKSKNSFVFVNRQDIYNAKKKIKKKTFECIHIHSNVDMCFTSKKLIRQNSIERKD